MSCTEHQPRIIGPIIKRKSLSFQFRADARYVLFHPRASRLRPLRAALDIFGYLWAALGRFEPLWATLGLFGPLWAALVQLAARAPSPEYRARRHLLSVRVEAGVGEALALVLAEEAAVLEHDVVDLVARAAAVQSVPVLGRGLALSAHRQTDGRTHTLEMKLVRETATRYLSSEQLQT